jgi:hypothetical protein
MKSCCSVWNADDCNGKMKKIDHMSNLLSGLMTRCQQKRMNATNWLACSFASHGAAVMVENLR